MLKLWRRSRLPQIPDAVIRSSANIRTVVNQDGGILLDIDRGRMLSSNPVGARIWQMIESGKSRTEIVAAVSADYGVPVDVVSRDVDEFVTVLRSQRLVE